MSIIETRYLKSLISLKKQLITDCVNHQVSILQLSIYSVAPVLSMRLDSVIFLLWQLAQC